MERTPEDDASSPAEISAEAISPNPAIAGVAKVSKTERFREWRRRVLNTDEARAREAERKRRHRKANNTEEARAKEAERKRLQRLRNIDETRAKEAEWKRRQRKAKAGKSSTSSATPRKRRAPPADLEAYRRRNADRVRAWRAKNARADAKQRFLETALYQLLQQVGNKVDVQPVTSPVRNAAASNSIRVPSAEMVQSRQCVRCPRRRTITTQTAPYQSRVGVQASTLAGGWNVGVQTRTFSISVGTQTKAWCSATGSTQKSQHNAASSLDQMRDCSAHEPFPSSSLTKCGEHDIHTNYG
ncbi:uncharacterized protein LOC119181442 isoform X1 [Rhipicephalus microplus]|uniref:uncharacterized protein LOC119181442 isoform X1 n=1 Tax=Rhipicephalus microplus TaxID=6941 RepID=UPI0018890748|nr:uncharacterized protein LOC119181442 isoform X2 [Rhipicephalus microplus]